MSRKLFLSCLLTAGLMAALFPIACAADDFTIAFGPKTYERLIGPPQTFTDTFSRCGTSACRIVVMNRYSSATIYLNGVQIFGPSDFQKATTLVKSVVLGDSNQLIVQLGSYPGSSMTITIECAASPATLSLGGPGVSLNGSTLLAAVPLSNTGTVGANNVLVSSLTLVPGTLVSPPLPDNLGTIPPVEEVDLNTTFSGGFQPLGSYPLRVQGTYQAGGVTYCFDLTTNLNIPPGAPGSNILGTVDIPSHETSKPYPHREPNPDEDEVNPPFWTVPVGPFVPPDGPPPGGTMVQGAELTGWLHFLPQNVVFSLMDPPPVVFKANNSIGNTANTSGTAEPSGASGGGVIFITHNWRAEFSTDGGNTFTQLDPTTIFPSDAVGFCCDQVVQYLPSVDRFVWLLQGTGYRLATASPQRIKNSNGKSWTYWNLTQSLFGSCTGFDYPDMSTGNTQLYMSWDAGGSASGCGGLQVVRTSFAGIQAQGTITLGFTKPSDSSMAWGGHLMHDTDDEIFWAGHNNTSNMRIFSLAEGSNTYFWRDKDISSWPNNSPLTSNTPDSMNWINFLMNPTTQNPGGGFPKNSVLGSTRVGNQLWFAWSAGTNNNFAQPHIQMVAFDRGNNFNKLQQVQIWNPDYAFAYPALARNACSGEIGLSFEYGGGGHYENHVVGFWGDFVAYQTTNSSQGSTRFGDYVSIRQAVPTDSDPGNLFTAFGYGRSSAGTSDVHYVLFGRPATYCQIIE